MSRRVMFTDRYDVAGGGMIRLLKHLCIHKGIPLGNLFGGPGLKCVIMLSLLHYFGTPIYWMLTRLERPLRFVYNRAKNLL